MIRRNINRNIMFGAKNTRFISVCFNHKARFNIVLFILCLLIFAVIVDFVF
jgi:hypothetical protein